MTQQSLALQLSRLESWTVLLTVTGFVLYGVIRTGQQTYAELLNLRPDDLGMGYSTSLIGAAALAGFLALLFLFGATVLFAAFTLFALIRVLRRGRVSFTRYLTSLAMGGLVLVVAYVGIVWMAVIGLFGVRAFPNVDLSESDLIFVLLLAVVLPTIVWFSLAPHFWRGLVGQHWLTYQHRVRRVRMLVLLGVAGLLLVLVSDAEGAGAAHSVRDGKPTASRLLGIRAERVTVTGSLPRGFTSPARLILLA